MDSVRAEKHKRTVSWRLAGALLATGIAVLAVAGVYFFIGNKAVGTPARASESARAEAAMPVMRGPSGLPLPRFVSLKSDKVRVRRGPSEQYNIEWVYRARGLPVEIVAEFEHWRRIRDADGEEGWIMNSLLSGWRTAMVAPWSKGADFVLREEPGSDAAAVARVKGGVIGRVVSCDGRWCRLRIGDYEGWIEQPVLWGVYRGEVYPARRGG